MTIHYAIKPIHPDAHLFEVTLTVGGADLDGQIFTLPNWIPGSYMIRDFSRNIVHLEATSDERLVAIEKLGKSTWQAPAGIDNTQLCYRVYAWDLSVRAAHLDRHHAFFNGTSVFLQVDGREQDAVSLTISAPEHDACQDWQVATSMQGAELDTHGFGLYRAANYDELIDHPVEIGSFTRIEFEACGVPHEIVLTGSDVFDQERLTTDLKTICEYQIRFFGGKAPIERYVFLVMVVGSGYGGLEHRASTALLISREHLPRPGLGDIDDRYLEFLGLCSHEYFHTWNIKRIKPARFVPYDLSEESPTRLLWFVEGITSYYDDLFLVRCGLIDGERYLSMLAKTLTRVQRGAGRLLQSVTDSSFDAWHKFYKQDENAPNAVVSYYAKGALVALCLDVEIRRSSDGQRTLDDLMKQLWKNWLETGDGLEEEEPEFLAAELSGTDLSDFFTGALYSTDDLPMSEALAFHGVELQWRARNSATDAGSVRSSQKEPGTPSTDDVRPWLGASLNEANGVIKVMQVYSGGPAEIAGLAGGDTLVAIERQALSLARVDQLLQRHQHSKSVLLHYFRLGMLYETALPISMPNDDTASLSILDSSLSDEWLKGR